MNKILKLVITIILPLIFIVMSVKIYANVSGDNELLGRDAIVYEKINSILNGEVRVKVWIESSEGELPLVDGYINFDTCKESFVNQLNGKNSIASELPLGEFKPLILLSPDQSFCLGLKKMSNWVRLTNSDQYRYVFYRYHNYDLSKWDGNSNFSTLMWQYNNIRFTDSGQGVLIEIDDISGLKYKLEIINL